MPAYGRAAWQHLSTLFSTASEFRGSMSPVAASDSGNNPPGGMLESAARKQPYGEAIHSGNFAIGEAHRKLLSRAATRAQRAQVECGDSGPSRSGSSAPDISFALLSVFRSVFLTIVLFILFV